MTSQNNLVDLMDSYFRLYASILTGLLRDFPEVHGVKTCIGRTEPLAYPTNTEGQGYPLPPFEDRAKRELASLVEATFALQRSCPVTDGRDEPVSVSAVRHGDEISIDVYIHDRLGGIHVHRLGRCAPDTLDAYFLFPVKAVLTVGDKNAAVIEKIREAAAEGFAQAARAAEAAGVILNRKRQAPEMELWLKHLPLKEGEGVRLDHFVGDYHRITAESPCRPLIIMVPETSFDHVSAKFSRNIVERLEPPNESLQMTP
jgi:hypothetical protein